jgi:hypothetical protein
MISNKFKRVTICLPKTPVPIFSSQYQMQNWHIEIMSQDLWSILTLRTLGWSLLGREVSDISPSWCALSTKFCGTPMLKRPKKKSSEEISS